MFAWMHRLSPAYRSRRSNAEDLALQVVTELLARYGVCRLDELCVVAGGPTRSQERLYDFSSRIDLQDAKRVPKWQRAMLRDKVYEHLSSSEVVDLYGYRFVYDEQDSFVRFDVQFRVA